VISTMSEDSCNLHWCESVPQKPVRNSVVHFRTVCIFQLLSLVIFHKESGDFCVPCRSACNRHAYPLPKANSIAQVPIFTDALWALNRTSVVGITFQSHLAPSVRQGFMLRILTKLRGKNYAVVVRQDCNFMLKIFI
jgi:hypothetical protein